MRAKSFKIIAGDCGFDIEGLTCRPDGDEGNMQVALLGGGEIYFSLFGAFSESLHGDAVLGQIDFVLAVELAQQILRQSLYRSRRDIAIFAWLSPWMTWE